MAVVLSAFPDPIRALKVLLEPLSDSGTRAPAAPWAGDPTYLRIRINGGADDRITDNSRIDIDTLTNDEQASNQLAERVRQLFISGPHRVDLGDDGVVIIDQIGTDTRPHIVPWGASLAIWNSTAAYSFSARRSE